MIIEAEDIVTWSSSSGWGKTPSNVKDMGTESKGTELGV